MGWKPRLKFSQNFHNRQELTFKPFILSTTSYIGDNHFSFLNITHHFKEKIDWNFAAHGKLWTYNLNYFEYLGQPKLNKKRSLELIYDFIDNETNLKDGLEPFPIALRSIFWIKFLSTKKIQDSKIDAFLYAQLQLLTRQLEYHLMGNHLLENGFALLFGAFYFQEKSFFRIAKSILLEQLEEQILDDGAHFELSPMYHQLMLLRVLDTVNLLANNPSIFDHDLLPFFQRKATKMMGWTAAMQFLDGTLPNLNDSTTGIAPTGPELLKYGQRLKLLVKKNVLKSSGYRKITTKNYEAIVDIGNIGPDYIPGHAHSDTFNIILRRKGKPVLVDTGISTYEKNAKRHAERSTAAHNTVKVREEEQSDVWGGFRVGYRAKITHLEERVGYLKATYNGYSKLRISHSRTFQFEEGAIHLIDEISDNQWARAYFHFPPNVLVAIDEKSIRGHFGRFTFDHFTKITLEKYEYAAGYNLTESATVAVVYFDKILHTTMHLKDENSILYRQFPPGEQRPRQSDY